MFKYGTDSGSRSPGQEDIVSEAEEDKLVSGIGINHPGWGFSFIFQESKMASKQIFHQIYGGFPE